MFLRYIHNFRAIAILLIVAGHCTWSMNWNNYQYPILKSLFGICFMNGTVLFVFIAGFLFQHLSSHFVLKQYLHKKLKFVILPYIIFSIPAIAAKLSLSTSIPVKEPVWLSDLFADWPALVHFVFTLKKIGWYIISGDSLTPFWFIPMISIFYMIAPILIYLDRHRKIYWSLPLFIAISIIVPRPIETTNILQSFLHFFSAYLLGMFASRYKERIIAVMEKLWIWVCFGIVAMVIMEVFHPGSQLGYSPYNFSQKMLLSMLLVYWLWRIESAIPKHIGAWGDNVASLSFGIYFIHYYFLYVAREVSWCNTFFEGSGIHLLVTFIITTLLSIASLKVAKIFLRNKSRIFIGC
jgi:peptidoglycan/LPS O-acetylase OafA/YrhL